MTREAVNPAAQRIVELVMQRLGFTSAAELVKALDMPPYSGGSVNLVRRWLRGDHGPSFDYTMEMLSKAGLLTPEADRAWRGEPAPTAAEEAAAAAALAQEAARRVPRDAEREARPRRGREKRG